MILESPVLGLLDVEILTPTGGFVLGRSRLNVDNLGDGDEELTWTAYLAVASTVDIRRGGKRSGVVNTMDVGTLSVTLIDAGDPNDTPDMSPGTPIRMLSKVTGEPIFQGAISDIDLTHTITKNTGKITTFVNITAADAVQAHANTRRYGAIAPAGFELWEERIARLATSSAVPLNPPILLDPIVRYSL